MSEKRFASEMRSGSQSMPLSVPIDTSAPLSIILAIGGTLPKYPLDVGQTTIGTSASAHLDISESVASHMWTTKAGSRERMRSMSSRILSLACMAIIFFLPRTSSAMDSM